MHFNHSPANSLQRWTLVAKQWGSIPGPHIFTCVAHTPGLGEKEEILQNWEKEASTLPPGPLKPTHCGFADAAKGCDQTESDTRDKDGGSAVS